MASPKFDSLLQTILHAISSGRSHHLAQIIDRCLDQASRVNSPSASFSQEDLARACKIHEDALSETIRILQPTPLDEESLKAIHDAFSSTAVQAAMCRPLYLLPDIVLPPSPNNDYTFSSEHSNIVQAAWLKFLLLLERLYSQETTSELSNILLPFVQVALLYIEGKQHFRKRHSQKPQPSQKPQNIQVRKSKSAHTPSTHQHVRDARKLRVLKDAVSSKHLNSGLLGV